MTALSTYGVLTGRRITPATIEWIADMAGRWGDDVVEGAIQVEARAGDLKKLLSRVQDRCAKQAIAKLGPVASSTMPRELHRDELLAIARGQRRAPDEAFTWWAGELTAEEYGELVASPHLRGSLREVAGRGADAVQATAFGDEA